MDLVVQLNVPFEVRLRRMIERDGPEAMGRFLYNEFAWHEYLTGMLAHARRVEVLKVGRTEEAVHALGLAIGSS